MMKSFAFVALSKGGIRVTLSGQRGSQRTQALAVLCGSGQITRFFCPYAHALITQFIGNQGAGRMNLKTLTTCI